jgi:hypothetical protein
MSKYQNLLSYLKKYKNYQLVSDEISFNTNYKVIFKCDKEHINTYSYNSFKNRFNDKTIKTLCSNCDLLVKENEDKENCISILKEKSPHTILNFENKKSIYFICFTCKSECHSYYTALLKGSSICKNCQNNHLRKDFQKLKSEVESFGMELLLEQKDYINNKQLLPVICVCGNKYDTVISSIKQGKNCGNCKLTKTVNTNLEKYGCENVFQNEDIKQKIKETCLEKYGETHHMKVSEILEKAKNTSLEKYGVEYAFCQDYVYEKIKKICVEKYGVEYPLQSQEIHEKCKKECLEKYGVEYPLQSKEIQNKIKGIFLEKYGVDNPLKCPKIREKIKCIFLEKYRVDNPLKCPEIQEKIKCIFLEKYGVDNPLKCPEIQEKIRNTFLERYGVKYPTQVPEFFHKAMKSMFSKKEFILPKTQRKLEIMGYENRAINSLLKKNIDEDDIIVGKDIPIFKYKDENEKDRVYFPDIFIRNSLLIIEVKSVYTFNLQPKRNFQKFKQVAKEGYIMKVMIYSDKNLYDIWYFIGDEFISKRNLKNKIFKFNEIINYDKLNDLEDVEDIVMDMVYSEIDEENFMNILIS